MTNSVWTRRKMLQDLRASFVAVTLAANVTAAPNYNFIIADDFGWTDNSVDAACQCDSSGITEGGIRVPRIFSCPGVIPAGTTNGTSIYSIDFYPTFVALAKGGTPEGYVLDGIDLTRASKDPIQFGARRARLAFSRLHDRPMNAKDRQPRFPS